MVLLCNANGLLLSHTCILCPLAMSVVILKVEANPVNVLFLVFLTSMSNPFLFPLVALLVVLGSIYLSFQLLYFLDEFNDKSPSNFVLCPLESCPTLPMLFSIRTSRFPITTHISSNVRSVT